MAAQPLALSTDLVFLHRVGAVVPVVRRMP